MPFKIVRNDITKMNTEAIVNTANEFPEVGEGCDAAIYAAAGYEELLAYRKSKIGRVPEGEAFLTPGFGLAAKYIIHTVSPLFIDGNSKEEEKLRSCYRKSLELAKKNRIESIAFPLISTGSFGYPKEEGMRVAVDEISAFLLRNQMKIFLVVFDEKSTNLGKNIVPNLEFYIDQHYVDFRHDMEYMMPMLGQASAMADAAMPDLASKSSETARPSMASSPRLREANKKSSIFKLGKRKEQTPAYKPKDEQADEIAYEERESCSAFFDFEDEHASKIEQRMRHMSDTFSEYLLYLIESKGMSNADVYKRAIVDKKVFSKIKNNPDYHPQKITAMCLCVGAKLNLDETKDLLARAGYALSPCDKTDVIFSYFIEQQIYDMIELDIQLEEHGQKCLIS